MFRQIEVQAEQLNRHIADLHFQISEKVPESSKASPAVLDSFNDKTVNYYNNHVHFSDDHHVVFYQIIQ